MQYLELVILIILYKKTQILINNLVFNFTLFIGLSIIRAKKLLSNFNKSADFVYKY